ncbi:GAF and ANTAR domain-containing protein [Paenarthrobacter nitroguajacolicus]|uniref:GAF and ANTAR domain-containing protein n=1 Tax=Paenarthrobacter nitroguajacolicus TaxID=211146 RepID=A0A558GRL3_PAENT|nr:GAF and ANTAR domain-containing protein [Paenarthrobacter nitroguajacolicus]TVU59522.1 GAF and ANTAR domain-containing protein [Paenarthrobacter nitroguajacolicus]
MTKKQLPLDELSTAIGRILGLLLTEEKVDHAVQSLSQAIRESVPGTIGAGVSILDSQGRRTSRGFTDTVVEQADFLQYQLGEGPCLTAWASEETVLVHDLSADFRWPEWTAAVSDLPITSVISTPLMAGGQSIGAIKVYSPESSAYDAATANLLELFATPAATLLSHIQSVETPKRISEGLQSALHSRDLVNRACGILMERHQIPHEVALQRLLKHTRDHRSSLQAVSAEIVAGIPADQN